jgi:hypothetical protein
MNGKRGHRGQGGKGTPAAPAALVAAVLKTVADFSYLSVGELLDELPELVGGDRDLLAPGHGTVLCRGLTDDGHAALTTLLTTGRIRVNRGLVRAGKGG